MIAEYENKNLIKNLKKLDINLYYIILYYNIIKKELVYNINKYINIINKYNI